MATTSGYPVPEARDALERLRERVGGQYLYPDGSRGFWRNAAFSRMDEEVLDAILEIAEALPGRGTGVDIHHLGGAFARVPDESTAFPNRTARFWMTIYKEQKYRRLQRVQRRDDPGNLFRENCDVAP
ncbi:hypothetical protein [Brachybacterium vulturis]|uniref:hypothetical protein n=1 Tax=Brachybacterium vulturis TaxID=2017484 RepID=UPI0015A8C33F|nr:hypothetical protein [Brachybacterium vulturis]